MLRDPLETVSYLGPGSLALHVWMSLFHRKQEGLVHRLRLPAPFLYRNTPRTVGPWRVEIEGKPVGDGELGSGVRVRRGQGA